MLNICGKPYRDMDLIYVYSKPQTISPDIELCRILNMALLSLVLTAVHMEIEAPRLKILQQPSDIRGIKLQKLLAEPEGSNAQIQQDMAISKNRG